MYFLLLLLSLFTTGLTNAPWRHGGLFKGPMKNLDYGVTWSRLVPATPLAAQPPPHYGEVRIHAGQTSPSPVTPYSTNPVHLLHDPAPYMFRVRVWDNKSRVVGSMMYALACFGHGNPRMTIWVVYGAGL